MTFCCKHGQHTRSCEICEKDKIIDRLRAQLQNCVDHLHHINRRYPREDMTQVIESANRALSEHKMDQPRTIMNRQLIRDAIAEAELANLELESAIDQPYCREFKVKISNAQLRLESAVEKLKELQRGA